MGKKSKKSSDSSAKNAKPTLVEELLGMELLTGLNESPVRTSKALESADLIAIYFGRGKDCQEFTPKLQALFDVSIASTQKGAKAIPALAVVYVSADKTLKHFEEIYSSMPWLSCGTDKSAGDMKSALAYKFQVKEVPSVAIVNSAGLCVQVDAKSTIEDCSREQDRIDLLTKWGAAEGESVDSAVLSKARSSFNKQSFLRQFLRQTILIFLLIMAIPHLLKYWKEFRRNVRQSQGAPLAQDEL